ncbi:hypothetical protein K7432_005461 [Basidiobolus ranarum]|uniref:F-box domain-containing protein n=1 Tax=Basidiobolus ranarum TaxID=34480 RepID=A0ABR2W3L7_9FUNG
MSDTLLGVFEQLSQKERIAFLENLVDVCSPYELHYLNGRLLGLSQWKFDFLSSLPQEIGVKILSTLDSRDLCSCREVSTGWCKLVSNGELWKKLCLKLSHSEVPSTGKVDWVKLYQHLYCRERNWSRGTPMYTSLLKGHRDRVYALKMKGDILVSGSYDRTVRVWNVTFGQCLNIFEANTVSCLDFIPELGILAAGSYTRDCTVWDMNSGQLLHTLSGHVAAISCLSINQDYLVTAGHDRFIIVWKWDTGEKVQTFCDHEQAIVGVHLKGNKILSSSKNGQLKVHDIDKRMCIYTFDLQQPCGVFSVLDVFENNVVCTTSATIYLLTWESGEDEHIEYKASRVSHGYVSCVGIHEKRIVIGCQYSRSGDSITLWNRDEEKLTNVDAKLALPICSTQLNREMIIAGCTDGRIYMFKFAKPIVNDSL